MENDFDFDVQGHLISYLSVIIYVIKRGNFEHNTFCIYNIYSLEIFSHVNLLSVSNQYELRK